MLQEMPKERVMSTWWEERTARVHQATDIVSVQAHCSSSEALALLRERAAHSESDLEDIALAVVGRRVSFAETNSRVSV
jgi:hypothetical protein